MSDVSTEAEKRAAVACIETITTGAEQKAQLVLVIAGRKPATELVLYSNNTSPEKAEDLLTRAGLAFERREKNKQQKSVAEYAVSKEKNVARQLLIATSDIEYGTLMGYPKTAIDAFVDGSVYEGALPDDISNSLFRMKFSKDHFQQEFEVVRSWNKILEEYSPSIANE